jgi:Fe-S-cluster containining protein
MDIRRLIAKATKPAELKAAQREALVKIDQVFSETLAETGKSIACKKGCHYCCYLKVDLMTAEAFVIAEYIRTNFSDEEVQEVKANARDNWKKIKRMDVNQHMAANLPCPLLRDGNCSIYPVRPSVCRQFHANKLKTCEDIFNDPKNLNLPNSMIPRLKNACGHEIASTLKSFADSGYDDAFYDLNPAILEALDNDKSEERWLNKRRAFDRNMRAKN